MAGVNAPLTLDDIADARAYERERTQFRDWIIQLKKVRRVSVGPIVTFVFENRDTIRFQVQELARAEKLYSDQAIRAELATYNPLIPPPGHLSATMFIELTSRDEVEHWLPRLAGIERQTRLVIGDGDGTETLSGRLDEAHASQLTREEVTASVHYLQFALTEAEIERFARDPVKLAVVHPEYREETLLSDATKINLLEDLKG